MTVGHHRDAKSAADAATALEVIVSEQVPTTIELAQLWADVLPRLMSVVASATRPQKPLGFLSTSQFRILKRLSSGQRLVSELARDLRVSAPTVSRAVESLVRRGLVERGQETGDRRVLPLRITSEGARSFEAAEERALRALAQVMEQVPADQRLVLLQALTAIGESLGPAVQAAGSPVRAPTPKKPAGSP